jgi:hypothetical protein
MAEIAIIVPLRSLYEKPGLLAVPEGNVGGAAVTAREIASGSKDDLNWILNRVKFHWLV